MAAPRGSEVWRDYVTDGIPSSGANKPKKSDIRSWSSWLESMVTSGVLSSGPWFATKAAMTLGYAANTVAIVYNDPTAANNGLYIKSGASGSGAWTQLTSFLPGYQFVTATPTGASTANAIVASTSPRLPAGDGVALVTLAIPATNTASPITVRFDGGSALTIKTRTGEDPDAGELQQNDVVAGFVSGATFRLISDLNSLRNYQSAKAWADNGEDVPVPASLGGDGVTTFSAKHWAAKSEEEADRSEQARDVAAGYASDAVSQGNVPIYGTVLGVSALNIPAGINAFRLNGYAAAGDLGGWFMAVEIPNSGTLLPWQVQTNDGTRRWEFRADEASVLSFGVKGDGTTDDRDAIYNALLWWKATGYTLRFPAGSYRMASGILLDMSGVAQAGRIIFEGAINPDPGIGKAITFRNMRGGRVFLRVNGGGQTADYTQADPVGCDEAFRFEGGKGWEATVYGKNYAGRVCRVTKSNDPNEFQGQLLKLSVHVDSSAEKTDAEAVRLAAGVGQAFFIDTGSVAFGEILSTICFWEKYGSVVENTTDVTHHFIETLYRGLTGFELRGVISYWGGSLNLGSELASPPDLLTIKASSTGPSHNIHLEEVFAAAGKIGVNVVQVGTDTLQGISIGVLHSRLNKQQGLVLNACRGFDVTHHSLSDNMGARVIGGSSYGTLRPHYKRSQIEGLEVGSSVFECEFCNGHILDVNQSNAANTPLLRAEGNTNRNYFNDIAYSSARINTVFLLTSGSKHRVRGKSAYNLNNGQLFNELPELFTDVAGWVDKASGSVVIPAGQTSIVVTHGMSAAPNRVFLQEYEPAGGIAKVNGAATSTQFTITIPAALGNDLRIDWRAQMRYSG
ncbi:glycosyl hydrolase family 28-related protein [Agrobacterium pusense]|uniref:glycosyl hydrolase family 28-related protein n=1 Tax=Agrobacterium pusense TaxID=648995 RepID=UPI002FDE61C9